MKGRIIGSIVLAGLFCAGTARAEEKKWSDVAEFSYVNTGGNTDVESLLFNNVLKYIPSEKVKGIWTVNALSAETDKVKTAQKYATVLRGDYKVSAGAYSYAEAGWMKDRFSGIEDRYTAGLGLGYAVLRTSRQQLDTEAGVTYTDETYTNNKDDNFAGGRLFAKYAYLFTDKNSFSQSAEHLHNFDNSDDYRLNAETAFIAALNGFLSLKTSYLVQKDNEPVPGSKDTDTRLAVTLVANF